MTSFSLSQVKRASANLPPRIVIYAEDKVGKSTFGSCAPSPIFIQTEDGLDDINPMAFPKCQSWNNVLSAITSLYQEAHEYKTVVLDTADWAERLLHKHIAKEKEVNSIEDLGYGKGYVYAAEEFNNLLDGLNALRSERGMCVIVLCHAEIKRFDDPLSNSYDRYVLKLHKQVGKLLREWTDILGFAKVDAATTIEKKNDFKKTERTRAVSTGRRVLHLAGSAAFDAGNRYSMPAVIDFSWASFADALNAARNSASK